MVGCTIALSGGNAGIGVLKCGGCPDPPEEAQLIPNLFFRAREKCQGKRIQLRRGDLSI